MVNLEVAVALGLGAGVAYVALSYFAGSLATSEKLKAYAKIELGELVISALVVTIVAAAYSGNLAEVFSGPGSDSFGTAEKIYSRMQNPLEKAVDSLMFSSYSLSKYMSYYYNIHAPIPGMSPIFSNSPSSGLGPLQMQLSMSLDTVTLNLFLVKAIKSLYLFLDFALRVFALPLGLILRCFPPARKIGGVLIGTALAVNFAFPAVVEWTTSSLAPRVQSIDQIGDPGNPPTGNMICSEPMQAVYTVGDLVGPLLICVAIFIASLGTVPIGTPGIYPFSTGSACWGTAGNIWGYTQYIYQVLTIPSLAGGSLVLDPDTAVGIFDTVLKNMLPAIVDINVAIVVMVVVQLAATIVLAKAFSEALGAEGQLYGIGRLI